MPQTRPKPPEEEPAPVPAPVPQPMYIVPPPAAPTAASSPKKLDEFEAPGGKFLVNGKLVNHDGQRIHEDGVPLTLDELAREV